MPLVDPILPSNIFEILKAASNLRTLDENKILCALANTFQDRDEISQSIADLEEAVGTDLRDLSSQLEQQLEHRLFATLVLHCLLHLRVHNLSKARACETKAKALAHAKGSSIDKRHALETLGLLCSLLDELEKKLSRIQPCLGGEFY